MDAEKILTKLVELWADQNNQQIISIEIRGKDEESSTINNSHGASSC